MRSIFYSFISDLPYRFETIQEKVLKKELAEKNDYIQKLEIQLETLREIIQK